MTPDDWNDLADAFGERVDHTTAAGWVAPAPCEGWVARDIVAHLVEWVPALLAAGASIDLGSGPDPVTDPAGAWHHLDDAIRDVLADPQQADAVFDHPMAGRHRVADAIASFVLGDVFLHTWDIARATGQDEQLDPAFVHEMLVGMEPMAEMLEQSGQYGPRVAVAEDADEQTRLLGLVGRRA